VLRKKKMKKGVEGEGESKLKDKKEEASEEDNSKK